MYCGVTTIAYDLATLPLRCSSTATTAARIVIRGRAADSMQAGGIGDLAYMLRWAAERLPDGDRVLRGQVAQFLLRGKAYAEIVDGPSGFLEQLLPRHPDRVFPSGCRTAACATS
jgi:hypothetical protein